MTMNRINKDKGFAIAGTIIFHGLILLLLFLTAFRTPLPLPGEEGVEVDLGLYNQGMGYEQPLKPAIPQQAIPAPPKNENKAKEEVVTQDSEETPAIAEKKQRQKQENTATPTQKQEKPVEQKPKVNEKALFKGSSEAQEGGSEGITGQPGDQGNANGLAGVKRYEGQGGQGNGPGYDLGGRGAKSLHRPSNDFTEEGTIVVDIWVNRNGDVTDAKVATKGTDIINSRMRGIAVNSALKSKFAADPTAPEKQKGTITYHFVINQ